MSILEWKEGRTLASLDGTEFHQMPMEAWGWDLNQGFIEIVKEEVRSRTERHR